METIISILKDLHDDVNYETEDKLIDNKILDSLDIVTLISELSDEFGIDIPPQEIVAENFNSAKALYAMVERLM